MLRKIGLILLVFNVLHAMPFSPKTNIDISFGPLFPSSQKIYVAKESIVNNGDLITMMDTLVHIQDRVKWMNGYTVDGRFGELTFLKLGLNLKFEHFFNGYLNQYFNETEGRINSSPVKMNLFLFQAGLISSFKLSSKIILEPEINLLYTESYVIYSTQGRIVNYGPYIHVSIGKIGLFTGLKLLYLKSDNINIGSNFSYSFYSEINDLIINPFFQIKLCKRLKCFFGLNYSILTNAINPKLGLNITLF